MLKANSEVVQAYSMDCYFRQYWRDERLSFKACFSILAITSVDVSSITFFFQGLKNNANNLVINQLSLNVAMLKKIWKPGKGKTKIIIG